MADIRCPECKKIDPARALDRVEKVSAIVAAGTSAGVGSGGLNIGQTALGTSLAMPSPPEYPTSRSVSVPSEPFKPLVHEAYISGRRIDWFGSGGLIGGVVGPSLAQLLNAEDFVIVFILLGILCGAGIGDILWIRHKKIELEKAKQKNEQEYEQAIQEYERAKRARESAEREQERAEQENKAARARHDQRLLQYQAAARRWNELYFCHRHDGLFLPDGRSSLIPREEMESFCGFP